MNIIRYLMSSVLLEDMCLQMMPILPRWLPRLKQNSRKYMKRFLAYMIVAMMSVSMTSCVRDFEERYDRLALDSTQYKLLPKGGSLMIMVYYSGSWTVSMMEEGVDWAYLTEESGKGIDAFRFRYDPSEGTARTVTLKVECDNGDTADIVLTQS